MPLLFILQALVLATPAPAPAPGPPRVLVLAPETSSVDAATIASLTGVITAALANDERLAVIGGADVADLAALEAQKQATGCDSNGCFAEIADALGARYVVFSDVNTLGDAVVLNLRVIDTTTSTSPWRRSLQESSVATVAERARAELRSVGDALVVGSVAAQPPSSQYFNTGIGLVVGGAAVGVGAMLADLLSPTSHDKSLEAVDWVWPASYAVVAPAAVIVGSVLAIANSGEAP